MGPHPGQWGLRRARGYNLAEYPSRSSRRTGLGGSARLIGRENRAQPGFQAIGQGEEVAHALLDLVTRYGVDI
jgi:hypothetical protein